MAAFILMNILPQVRVLFALAPLGWAEIGFIAGAVAIWLPLVRLFWRRRLIARFLGLQSLFEPRVLNEWHPDALPSVRKEQSQALALLQSADRAGLRADWDAHCAGSAYTPPFSPR